MLKNTTPKIYSIRNKQVILDRDLASMYQVNINILNRAIVKNPKRFPGDFMLRLNKKESNELGSSYAFTAPGVAMASTILNSRTAILVNIEIVRIKRLIDE